MKYKLILSMVLVLLSSCSTVPNSCNEEDVNCLPVRTVIKKVESRSLFDLNKAPNQEKQNAKNRSVKKTNSGIKAANYKDNNQIESEIKTVRSGDPLLTMPRQLRLWVNRYEDADGDWNDETYIILRLDDGRWRVGIDATQLTR